MGVGWLRSLSVSAVLTATVITGGVAVQGPQGEPSAPGLPTDVVFDAATPVVAVSDRTFPSDLGSATVKVARFLGESPAEKRAAARERARLKAEALARAEAREKRRLVAERVAARREARAERAALLAAPLNMSVVTANVPNRSSEAGYRSTLAAIVARAPDLITLNEQSGRSLEFIESAAPGYTAWRDPVSNGDSNSMANVVLWRTDTYTPVSTGRVQLVNNDRVLYKGNPVVWDRFAAWVSLERIADGVPVALVSTHMMTNPSKYGPNFGARQAQYGRGMDTLVSLTESLGQHGPVFVGGDMNTHVSQGHLGWAAVAKMRAAGYQFVNHSVDYVFYPTTPRLTLVEQTSGPTPEPDHRWVYARFG